MPPVVVNISRLPSADHTGDSSSCASKVTRVIVARDESNIQMSWSMFGRKTSFTVATRESSGEMATEEYRLTPPAVPVLLPCLSNHVS